MMPPKRLDEMFVEKPPFTQDAEHLATAHANMGHTMVNGSVHTGCKQH